MRRSRAPRLLTAAFALTLAGGLAVGSALVAGPVQAADPTASPTATAPRTAAQKAADKKADSWSATPFQRPGQNDTTLRTSFFIEAQPGATVYDSLQLGNQTGARLPLTIYSSDGYNISKGGNFTVLPQGADMKDVGTWVTPADRKVTVPKDKGLVVPFKVTVPRSATPGDHIGAMVTLGAAPNTATPGSTVKVQRAIAVKMYVRVGGVVNSAMVVEKVDIKAKPALLPLVGDQGEATVTYTYRNVGNLVLRPKATITLKGLFGRTLHTATVEEAPEVFPGQAIILSETFEGIPVLDRLDAKVDLVSEGSKVTGEQGASASGESTKWVISWVVLLAVLFGIAFIVFWRWRKRADATPPPPGDVQGGTPAATAAAPGRRRAAAPTGGGRRRASS